MLGGFTGKKSSLCKNREQRKKYALKRFGGRKKTDRTDNTRKKDMIQKQLRIRHKQMENAKRERRSRRVGDNLRAKRASFALQLF
ncbi:hypothetical protein M5K25_020924 [Dendrobium thyrsiflorum]|uniref:Uncharacterized protein n=1 Tax=Dendrobium thyrsiflorum TaxID=117978 RepID=A0ABD0UII8_DENTH